MNKTSMNKVIDNIIDNIVDDMTDIIKTELCKVFGNDILDYNDIVIEQLDD